MKSNHLNKTNLDIAGAFASGLCALHCSALPLIISLTSVSSLSFLQTELFEWLFIVTAVLIAVPAFLNGYKLHRNVWILSAAFFSFFVILSSHSLPEQWHHWANAAGGCMLVFTHLMNYRATAAVRHKCV
ncbi:MAG: MerC domain-containing protein [Saprospiraceae bacterium]|nr:MerC domain-containing protein [Saprospiraceae bacterium]MBP7699333.1 MerC domain-containing protein [Saprospiraceae bacterium]